MRLDLGALAREEAARSRAVPVEITTDAAVSVQGRADQLVRVVANLLDNATRHARGTVRLTITRRDHTGRLVVDDDGPGIPASDRERVFERFARLEAGRARSAGGAGLGLALVRAIVERHHGRVWVDDAPTGGARLIVELPSTEPKRILRVARARAPGQPALPSGDARHGPSGRGGHGAEAAIGIDRDRMPDGSQHRQVGRRIHDS